MPYSKKKVNGKTQVVNSQTGKVMGTHPSDSAANAQLKALYANEPKAKPKKKK